MKDNEMNNRLNFYKVNDKYIEYISKFDNHIAYNKNTRRPYIGIILYINSILYFAPLFSPKPQHEKYKDNISFLKIYGNIEKTDYLGLIRFSDMIPVVKEEVTMLKGIKRGKKYNALLIKQYNYINQLDNRIRIRKNAKQIHDIVVSKSKNRSALFYKNLCCDFKLLEQKCIEYKPYNKEQ